MRSDKGYHRHGGRCWRKIRLNGETILQRTTLCIQLAAQRIQLATLPLPLLAFCEKLPVARLGILALRLSAFPLLLQASNVLSLLLCSGLLSFVLSLLRCRRTSQFLARGLDFS
jgi:hypothetical protein